MNNVLLGLVICTTVSAAKTEFISLKSNINTTPPPLTLPIANAPIEQFAHGIYTRLFNQKLTLTNLAVVDEMHIGVCYSDQIVFAGQAEIVASLNQKIWPRQMMKMYLEKYENYSVVYLSSANDMPMFGFAISKNTDDQFRWIGFCTNNDYFLQ